jgi:CheY-like chemotaxis protein
MGILFIRGFYLAAEMGDGDTESRSDLLRLLHPRDAGIVRIACIAQSGLNKKGIRLADADEAEDRHDKLASALNEQWEAFEKCRSAFVELQSNLRREPWDAHQAQFKKLLNAIAVLKKAVEALTRLRPEILSDQTMIDGRQSPRRILVVDDNKDDASILGLLLQTLGHKVDVAHDGTTAIGVARGTKPEFVFVDLVMPGLDGYKTAKLMRQEIANPKMQIIAVSGYSAEPESLHEAGINRHIFKPMDPMWLEGFLGHGQSPGSGTRYS